LPIVLKDAGARHALGIQLLTSGTGAGSESESERAPVKKQRTRERVPDREGGAIGDGESSSSSSESDDDGIFAGLIFPNRRGNLGFLCDGRPWEG